MPTSSFDPVHALELPAGTWYQLSLPEHYGLETRFIPEAPTGPVARIHENSDVWQAFLTSPIEVGFQQSGA